MRTQFMLRAGSRNSALNTLMRRKRARGLFGMSDEMSAIAVALALAAVVAGVGYGVWSQFFSSNEIQAVNTIYRNLAPKKSAGGGYGANVNLASVLISTDGVPPRITISSDGKLYNNYNGEITITSSADGMYFTITEANIPATKCPEIVQSLGNSNLFRSITVGSATLSTFPMLITEATTACGTTGDVTISFVTKS